MMRDELFVELKINIHMFSFHNCHCVNPKNVKVWLPTLISEVVVSTTDLTLTYQNHKTIVFHF